MRRLLRGGSTDAGDDSLFENEKFAARIAPSRFRKSRAVWTLQASIQAVQETTGLEGST